MNQSFVGSQDAIPYQQCQSLNVLDSPRDGQRENVILGSVSLSDENEADCTEIASGFHHAIKDRWAWRADPES